jgi:hypothetical protein
MEYIKSIYTNIEKIIVNTLFNVFWKYNYYVVVIEEKLKPYLFLPDYVKKMFVVTDKKTEPNLDFWNCTVVVNMNLKVPKLIEQYKYGSEEEYNISVLETETEFEEVLFLRKSENSTISKIKIKDFAKPAFDEISNPNNTRFLNIMYFHKNMSEPIKINLDVSYIRNGNEIFSKTFIYRSLCYQYNPKDYHFDENYELYIMDYKIQKHTLNATQYLFFDDKLKTGYDIRKISE